MDDKILPDRGISDNVLIALRKIIQAVDLNSKKLVKRVGLTAPQLVILHFIQAMGEVSVGEVAKNVSLSHGTVTGILERVEKRGLVTRQKNSRDKRRVMVSVTESGKKLLRTAPPVMQENFLGKFDRLQEWEQTMILSALQRLVSMLNARELRAEPFLSAASIENVLEKKSPAKGSSSKP